MIIIEAEAILDPLAGMKSFSKCFDTFAQEMREAIPFKLNWVVFIWAVIATSFSCPFSD